METVFITIHDLSQDARIKYCSDSVEDILGYLPYEVTGKSCWEYFHPDEIPFARAIQGRGISLDKAAVMNYARIKHKDGSWVGCECVFTVVHDVLVATTAIYRRGPKARQRAIAGAGIRRIFSSSPRDPRYHMLSFLSNKFYQEPTANLPEPRAALFLNRFTRTSTIMYATDGIESILGIRPSDIIGKSFYYCIEENCLADAVKCLESAKANDSIAYLRFWYRDPLQEDNRRHASIEDEEDDDEDGGVPLNNGIRASSTISMEDATPTLRPSTDEHMMNGHTPAVEPSPFMSEPATTNGAADMSTAEHSSSIDTNGSMSLSGGVQGLHNERSSSDQSTDLEGNAADAIFDRPELDRRSTSQTPPEDLQPAAIEVEAVVSCTSDGLVVILRRARPLVPHTVGATEAPYYANGVFASPWAPQPVMPDPMQQTTQAPATSFPMANPVQAGFMDAIRDVAVFAWSLTGINGSLAQYANGHPADEAQPPDLSEWDPNAQVDEQTNDRYNGFYPSTHRPQLEHGESIESRRTDDLGSSDDEVLWKRQHTMSSWRRPKRRADRDGFDGDAGDGENEHGGRKRAWRSHSGSAPGTASGGGSGSAADSSSS